MDIWLKFQYYSVHSNQGRKVYWICSMVQQLKLVAEDNVCGPGCTVQHGKTWPTTAPPSSSESSCSSCWFPLLLSSLVMLAVFSSWPSQLWLSSPLPPAALVHTFSLPGIYWVNSSSLLPFDVSFFTIHTFEQLKPLRYAKQRSIKRRVSGFYFPHGKQKNGRDKKGQFTEMPKRGHCDDKMRVKKNRTTF